RSTHLPPRHSFPTRRSSDLDAWRALPNIVRAFDEPFGNNSAIGGYLCAEMAANAGMTLLLAGDGGDEIFGGNERYRKDKIYSWLDRKSTRLNSSHRTISYAV